MKPSVERRTVTLALLSPFRIENNVVNVQHDRAMIAVNTMCHGEMKLVC